MSVMVQPRRAPLGRTCPMSSMSPVALNISAFLPAAPVAQSLFPLLLLCSGGS